MKPVTYHLTEEQLERLRAESERTGLTVAELIRRAVDGLLPPPADSGIEPFRYKGYVGLVRAEARKIGKRWSVHFVGVCNTERSKLDFQADTLEDARTLFEWMVDRIPETHGALVEAMEKATREYRKR